MLQAICISHLQMLFLKKLTRLCGSVGVVWYSYIVSFQQKVWRTSDLWTMSWFRERIQRGDLPHGVWRYFTMFFCLLFTWFQLDSLCSASSNWVKLEAVMKNSQIWSQSGFRDGSTLRLGAFLARWSRWWNRKSKDQTRVWATMEAIWPCSMFLVQLWGCCG